MFFFLLNGFGMNTDGFVFDQQRFKDGDNYDNSFFFYYFHIKMYVVENSVKLPYSF